MYSNVLLAEDSHLLVVSYLKNPSNIDQLWVSILAFRIMFFALFLPIFTKILGFLLSVKNRLPASLLNYQKIYQYDNPANNLFKFITPLVPCQRWKRIFWNWKVQTLRQCRVSEQTKRFSKNVLRYFLMILNSKILIHYLRFAKYYCFHNVVLQRLLLLKQENLFKF